MPRRAKAIKKELTPDAHYHNLNVTKLINKIMQRGKKSVAERITYNALSIIEEREKASSVTVLEQAIRNSSPLLRVKPRRVGGSTYQVPVEVSAYNSLSLSIRWLVNAAGARTGKSMAEKLAAELIDAAKGQGAAVKKRDDTHRMAEANRAFAHYRW